MNNKRIIALMLLPLLFGMVSCGSNKSTTLYLTANYVYGSSFIQSASGKTPAALLTFNNSVLGKGFEGIEVPSGTIAGDCLEIKFTGEVLSQETYPGTMILNGKLTSYAFHSASVHTLHVDDGYVGKESFGSYLLSDENVILNNNYEYKDIDDAKLTDAWYAEKWVYIDPNDSKIYGPSIIEISGLFAFDPASLR